MNRRKTYGTGDGVSIVGGEWTPDASIAAALAALATALESIPRLPAPARDPEWQWPPLDIAA